ncbi:methyltransferase domain-containing protein [Bacillaceae bacterium SIJ1]|uniref:class I SAM-dependent methyltransferase n=1 Tax=Litoribacterium kuwaitense TaxID=1398745 RepID=UPI0013EA4407|nr:class I SAM-dependent methyltransferase [Litoribacterium kuwaitense]NGP46603.1 methyltransferase domain-containing protein [Litoribacterium kuwaitense]
MTHTDQKWNASLYDTKHAFVSQYGSSLIEWLQPKAGEHILDVGCGTGDLSHSIAATGAQVTGIDASREMIEEAKEKYPKLAFFVVDAHELPFSEQFDAVFSNAALHWMLRPSAVLTHIAKSLKPQGRFVAEFGGQGNVETIRTVLLKQCHAHGLTNAEAPWYFPSIGEYTSRMESAGFVVTQAVLYDRPTPLKGEDGLQSWIHMFADGILSHTDTQTTIQIIKATEQELKPLLYENNTWTADYRRLRVTAYKA